MKLFNAMTGQMPGKIMTVALLLTMCIHNASADTQPPRYNQVSFSVSAETEVANDELVVTLRAIEQGKDFQQLANSVNETMAWALKQAERADSVKAQTLNYQTQPQYAKNKQIGWQVSQTLSLRSTDTDTLSELLGKLQSRLQMQSASFQVTEKTRHSVEDELHTEALQRFQRKAELITRSLGRASYRLVQINLNGNNPGQPRPMMSMARGMMAAEAVSAPAFEGGTQKLAVNATGTIEISD